MSRMELSRKDISQIEKHGLTVEEVRRQTALFEKGAPFANLDRPCTVGDGIRRFSEEDVRQFVRVFEESAPGRQIAKFVPASGAATRMFRALLKVHAEFNRIERRKIADAAAEKGGEYAEVLEFIDNLDKFAFHEFLADAMANNGYDLQRLRSEGDYTATIDHVLTDRGLSFSDSPKGQIPFHRYPDGARTAFEEHLVEAAGYIKDESGVCRLHFTVSPGHEKGFRRLLEEKGPAYEKAFRAGYEVGFSRQYPSTDTIAVDLENRPFREPDGHLLFRPGGHGSLIRNLNSLDGDIVFIKNIDNVAPDRLKPDTYLWKKALGGYLFTLERKIRAHLYSLAAGREKENDIAAAGEFVRDELSVMLPEKWRKLPLEKKRKLLDGYLARPIRVCGMVPASGEPGGGPFWVRNEDGGMSIQIVESAQINQDAPDQQAVLKSLTHFNPVDIICSLRNEKGVPYDLRQYIDQNAVFISKKSRDGKDLKALEHPGLWNGAMAFWNTVFVEVPLTTFNPVKTVNDLLRDTHQA